MAFLSLLILLFYNSITFFPQRIINNTWESDLLALFLVGTREDAVTQQSKTMWPDVLHQLTTNTLKQISLTNVVAVKASLQMKIRRAHTLTSVMFISWTELLWQVFTAFFTCCILLPCYKRVDHITRKAENTEEGKQTKPCDINKTHMMKVVLKREIHLYFGIKANNL